MAVHKITRGLDLPILGVPQTKVTKAPAPSKVAIIADDYPGMKPKMMVEVGDAVKRGQKLFEDRKTPGVFFTSPGAGKVVGINRGAKRALISVVVELSDADKNGESVSFDHYKGGDIDGLDRDAVVALLTESGLWTALRSRPFGKVPSPETTPFSLFITATDTNPLAMDPDIFLAEHEEDWQSGVAVLHKLCPDNTYVCRAQGSKVRVGTTPVRIEEFAGKHPAGLVGTHIHRLAPADRNHVAWHAGYQDVVAIGKLFKTGKLWLERQVALGGSQVKEPRLLQTRMGAYLDEILEGELVDGDNRVISGSVLSGRKAMGEEAGYLGRYANQISVLREGNERVFLGWIRPDLDFGKFSVTGAYLSKFLPQKLLPFSTSQEGEHREMVPIGSYEKVMPLDIMPTFLLRALAVDDVENAEKLGALELDEEDLALCTFVCPGKNNWGAELRRNLNIIEKEG